MLKGHGSVLPWLRLGRVPGPACQLMVVALVCTLTACGGGDSLQDDVCAQSDAEDGLLPVCADVIDPSEVKSGGGNTVALRNTKAFSKSNPQLGFIDFGKFKSGDFEFRGKHDGLGPLFNNQTCQGCHKEDGRGNLPNDSDGDGETDQPMVSMLVRLSVPVTNTTDPIVVRNGVQPEPIYGGQIQVFGGLETPGKKPVHDGAISRQAGDVVGEAFVSIFREPCRPKPFTIQYADGTSYELLCPTYRIRDLAYGPFRDDVRFSPRVASQVVGLGLLEAIPDDDLVKYADPDDRNDDGVSGRPNRVWDVWTENPKHLGRFGHKASKPTLLHQLAAAYLGDIGITSSLFPDENCTILQPACLALAEEETHAGEVVDLDDLILALVEFYVRQLAVPQRRGWYPAAQRWEPQIWRGRQLFFEAGCVACHVPRHVTGNAVGSVLGEIVAILDELREPTDPLPLLQSLSNQVIWPFTDLLLHDMGGVCTVTREVVTPEEDKGRICNEDEKETEFCWWVQRCNGLADGRGDFLATGSEWRTPPLWGLGLVQVVNERAGFLHDGRARTIEEAILWHGQEDSEGRGAWEFFVSLSSSERGDLLAFLESL